MWGLQRSLCCSRSLEGPGCHRQWSPPYQGPSYSTQPLMLMLSLFIFEASLDTGRPSSSQSSPVQSSAAVPHRMRQIQMCGYSRSLPHRASPTLRLPDPPALCEAGIHTGICTSAGPGDLTRPACLSSELVSHLPASVLCRICTWGLPWCHRPPALEGESHRS